MVNPGISRINIRILSNEKHKRINIKHKAMIERDKNPFLNAGCLTALEASYIRYIKTE